ncbi:hypothetical protein RRG08_018422 [Elysia crispata]|uniref:Uncharacterized protein n=1 Tax=Elysia crispata TaxID=231223 RepID=A0AAE1ECC8_9GAST|nr:hypothetical protein RRG08_018422 [Elysia crispata]
MNEVPIIRRGMMLSSQTTSAISKGSFMKADTASQCEKYPKDALSFEKIRNIHNGHLYPSFREASRQSGILQSGKKGKKSLKYLLLLPILFGAEKSLFVILILYKYSDPVGLWTHLQTHMSEDFTYEQQS